MDLSLEEEHPTYNIELQLHQTLIDKASWIPHPFRIPANFPITKRAALREARASPKHLTIRTQQLSMSTLLKLPYQ
jgi:hypothetical protein